MSDIKITKKDGLSSLDTNKLVEKNKSRTSKRLTKDSSWSYRSVVGVPGKVTNVYDYETQPEVLNYTLIEKMGRDDVISFAYNLLTSLIVRMGYTVKCDDDLQKFIIDKTLKTHFNNLVYGLSTAYKYGYVIAQKVFKREDVRKTVRTTDGAETIVSVGFDDKLDLIAKIVFLKQDDSALIKYKDIKTGNLAAVSKYIDGVEVVVRRSDLVHYAYDSSFNPIFGRSKLNDVYVGFESGAIATKGWLSEIDGAGQRVVEVGFPMGFTIDPDTNENTRNDVVAARIAKDVLTKNAYAVPSNRYPNNGEKMWEVKLSEIALASGGKRFESSTQPFIDEANKRKARGMGMPPSLILSEYRSTDELSAALQLFILQIHKLVTGIEQTIKTDVLDDVIRMNMAPDKIVDYTFELDFSALGRDNLLKTFGQMGMTVQGQMLASGAGVPSSVLDMSALFDQLHLPHIDAAAAFSDADSVDVSDNDSSPSGGGSQRSKANLLGVKAKNDRDNTVNRKTERDNVKS